MHGIISVGNYVEGKNINPMLDGFTYNKELKSQRLRPKHM